MTADGSVRDPSSQKMPAAAERRLRRICDALAGPSATRCTMMAAGAAAEPAPLTVAQLVLGCLEPMA